MSCNLIGRRVGVRVATSYRFSNYYTTHDSTDQLHMWRLRYVRLHRGYFPWRNVQSYLIRSCTDKRKRKLFKNTALLRTTQLISAIFQYDCGIYKTGLYAGPDFGNQPDRWTIYDG